MPSQEDGETQTQLSAVLAQTPFAPASAAVAAAMPPLVPIAIVDLTDGNGRGRSDNGDGSSSPHSASPEPLTKAPAALLMAPTPAAAATPHAAAATNLIKNADDLTLNGSTASKLVAAATTPAAAAVPSATTAKTASKAASVHTVPVLPLSDTPSATSIPDSSEQQQRQQHQQQQQQQSLDDIHSKYEVKSIIFLNDTVPKPEASMAAADTALSDGASDASSETSYSSADTIDSKAVAAALCSARDSVAAGATSSNNSNSNKKPKNRISRRRKKPTDTTDREQQQQQPPQKQLRVEEPALASGIQIRVDQQQQQQQQPQRQSSQQPRQPRRRRRLSFQAASVSFAPQVTVHSIHPGGGDGDVDGTGNNDGDSSDDPNSSAWYSVAELHSMRYQAMQTVVEASRAYHLSASSSDSSTVTYHGLEGMFRPIARQRKILKHNLRETMQLQQDLEKLSGPDPEWLAILYHNITTPSRERARKLAMLHERDVQDMWRQQQQQQQQQP